MPKVFGFPQNVLEEDVQWPFFLAFATRPLTKMSYVFSLHNFDILTVAFQQHSASRQPQPRPGVLNHRVFAVLKFHSALDEIWGVKNCHFPPFSCIPEGNFGRWPKAIQSKSPVEERCGPGSRNRPGCQASHGERCSNSALSFSPNTCSLWFMFFLSVI